MKKKLQLAVCMLHVITASLWAQNEETTYRPFAGEGNSWVTQVGGLYENRYYGYFEGDTIIGGKTWIKVYTEKYFFPQPKRAYYAAVRDEGEKVYAIANGSDKPRLLYDFSLKEGDFIRCGIEGNVFACLHEKDEPYNAPVDTLFGFPFAPYLKVDRIDIVKLRDGLTHRRFWLTMWDACRDLPIATPIVWVEGIGSGAGPFLPWMLQSPQYPDPNKDSRVCVTGWSSASTPNLTTSNEIYELEYPTEVRSLPSTHIDKTSFDLQGRKALSPRNGIYIKDGKKTMIK